MTTSSQSETIGQALGNRDVSRVATVGKDYQLVDATLVFEVSRTLLVQGLPSDSGSWMMKFIVC